MRFLIRQMRRDETDPEAVIGLGIIPLFVLVCVVLMNCFPGLLPRCRFHDALGIPCPGCGSLKCAEFLAHGRVPEAFLAQPLSCVAAFAGAAYLLYSAVVVPFKLPRLRLIAGAKEWKAIAVAAIAAGLANWAYLLLLGD
jgi:hypothetical protein